MIHVVSGALIRDGKVLMGLRKQGGLRPDLWELPGGKVDPGETPEQALAREWHEELGCEVTVGRRIAVASLRLDSLLVVDLYIVELSHESEANQPSAIDHQDLDWVTPTRAMRRLPCSPAFYLHYYDLNQYVVATRPMSSCDFVGDSGCSDLTCEWCHP